MRVNNNIQTLVMTKEEYGFSEQGENPRGHNQLKRQKFPLIRCVFPNKLQKAMVMLNNKNMKISILAINRKSIITLMNNLLYLSDSRHLCAYSNYIAYS